MAGRLWGYVGSVRTIRHEMSEEIRLLHREIEELRRRLRSAEEREELLRRVLARSPEATLIVDSNDHAVEVNEAARRLLGVEARGDVLGTLADGGAPHV